MDFRIDLNQLKDALPVMGMGMLGIFIIASVMIGCIWLLNKIPAGKNDKK